MWKWEAENDAKGVVVIAHNILEHTEDMHMLLRC